MSPERGEHERSGDDKAPDLRRQGPRRAAGADTPSGPDTDRTATPAMRQKERIESEGGQVYPPTDEEEEPERDEEGEEEQDLGGRRRTA